MDKVLSIVIPTYNMEKYLDKCLTSLIVHDEDLMNQLEVLVVIDGAKDRSSEIAHVYQKKHPETFVVIDKENGNYGSCVNRGLKEAKGKYIKVLDADDSFDTLSFKRYLHSLLNIDTDLVINNYSIVNEKGGTISKHNRSLDANKLYEQKDILPYLTSNYLAMHEVAYKVSLLREHNYVQTEGISYTDQEWVLFPVAWAKTVSYINENIYLYLVGREGQTVSSSVASRSVGHSVIRIKNTISLYNKYQEKDDLSGQYVKKRIVSESERIYLRYIYMGRDVLDINELKSFDQEVKDNNLEIYNALENEKLAGFIPFRYIAEWRKGNLSKIKFFNPVVDLMLAYKKYNFNIKSALAR